MIAITGYGHVWGRIVSDVFLTVMIVLVVAFVLSILRDIDKWGKKRQGKK